MTQSLKPVNDLTFREAMDELEAIVASLESNEMELEESIKSVALLTSLKTRLNGAQQKVEVLMGELSEAPEDEIQDTTLS